MLLTAKKSIQKTVIISFKNLIKIKKNHLD